MGWQCSLWRDSLTDVAGVLVPQYFAAVVREGAAAGVVVAVRARSVDVGVQEEAVVAGRCGSSLGGPSGPSPPA